ncbi:MAG: copper resistance protein CopC [Gammaproteobacteria bacterium]|jgi:methionine-rich copper-binding protein CopC
MKQVLMGILIVLAAQPWPVRAHAFPMHQTPGAGAELSAPPPKVQILFDAELEAPFSTLRVVDESNHSVCAGKGHVVADNNHLLVADLKPLGPGKYHVFWSVVSRDGHRTKGDYTFRVEP